VNGAPVSEAQKENPGEQASTKGSVRITVTISMSNGVFVKQMTHHDPSDACADKRFDCSTEA